MSFLFLRNLFYLTKCKDGDLPKEMILGFELQKAKYEKG
jgi:hypothetical protein